MSVPLPTWYKSVCDVDSGYSIPPPATAVTRQSRIFGRTLYTRGKGSSTEKETENTGPRRFRSHYYKNDAPLQKSGKDAGAISTRNVPKGSRFKYVLDREALPQPFTEEFLLDCDLRQTLCQLMHELEYEITPDILEKVVEDPRYT